MQKYCVDISELTGRSMVMLVMTEVGIRCALNVIWDAVTCLDCKESVGAHIQEVTNEWSMVDVSLTDNTCICERN
jgi:hypothetical protein